MYKVFPELVDFCKELYPGESPVALHAPRFRGNEKQYLGDCIESTFVSYVGKFVTDFEERIKVATGARHAVALVNGTAALQLALQACGVGNDDLVVTQSLTFVATANAIRHAGAEPAFVDVEADTMGMSPAHLQDFLKTQTRFDGKCWREKVTGKRIAAILPMHTFGHPVRIEEIMAIAESFDIPVVEDAAESLGSLVGNRHTGCFGKLGILSFNGNKIITTGGGGMVITDDKAMADWVRNVSSTAKRKHRWEFFHDELAYNLRMPNVNAAVGVGQMEQFEGFLCNKRETARKYAEFGAARGLTLFGERPSTKANHWLNCLVLQDRQERDTFLQFSNDNGVQTRPIWVLMSKLPMYQGCQRGDLTQSEWFEDRIVNLPSSVRV